MSPAPAAPAAPAAAGDMTLEQRRQALTVLAEEVNGCTRCPELASTRTQTVFADGPPGAELCFIGEAPGADEDAQGLPFVGAAGQLLNKIIAACGLKREEVYICNILKCRPPGNRTPLPRRGRQLPRVPGAPARPGAGRSSSVALGGSRGDRTCCRRRLPLGKLRGKFHDYRGIPVIVTYHPAYLLPHRAPEKKSDVWEDMKMLLKAWAARCRNDRRDPFSRGRVVKPWAPFSARRRRACANGPRVPRFKHGGAYMKAWEVPAFGIDALTPGGQARAEAGAAGRCWCG